MDPTKETLVGKSLPFLFTLIAIAVFLIVWIFGKCIRNRNFSGNFYYGCLRFIYFAAIIGTTVHLYINNDPKLYSYLFIGILFLHLMLSWMSGRSFKAIYKNREFGGCRIEGVPRAGKPSPLFFVSAKEAIAFKLAEALSKHGTEDDPEYLRKVGT